MGIFSLLVVAGLTACNQDSGKLALGMLERDRVALSATASEIIIALPVKKGSYVKKGTVLVQLDASQQQAELDRLAAEVARAQASLDKEKSGPRAEDITQARAQVATDKALLSESQLAYNRYKDLMKSGTASESQYDKVFTARAVAQAVLEKNQSRLDELLAGNREEDIRIAQADLMIAKASLANQQSKLSDLTVKASRDGWLDSLPWNLGERVTQGSPVAILLAGAAPYARVYVPEPSRVKVKQGDKLQIKIDGLDSTYEGTVSWISSDPSFTPYYGLNQQDRTRLMYLAEIQLPESASDLPNGIPVQVILP
ncbi:HlyD family secretion protein [Flexibacterium corallicola]|uniref:HlyD family secretion protein n=1 Tax=Flexibacterium corallicola TaxID=3037259 RepID=UPI00286EDE58|nr:HlyD family efflux transporter periplasmic adaptor subunit [Pseudovibrio sp. M1P-2-3]